MKQLLTIAACSTLLAFAVPASAHTSSDDALASLKSPTSAAASVGVQMKIARHGADDRSGDDRGGRNGGDGKGRGGHDDGPGHT
jgi:hypothetical protein